MLAEEPYIANAGVSTDSRLTWKLFWIIEAKLGSVPVLFAEFLLLGAKFILLGFEFGILLFFASTDI